MERAVVLFSGGLDSTTVLALARAEGLECHALTLDYGQRHRAELDAAKRIATEFNVADHRVVRVELNQFGGSALTDNIEVPKAGVDPSVIPITYVPARNTIFLSLALGFAEAIHAGSIWIGVNAVDFSGYPDCRPEFIEAYSNLVAVATKAGVEGNPIRIQTPLLWLSKREIIQLGLAHGVPYSMTQTCYDPGPGGEPCRRCDACRIRMEAFAELGMEDPALGNRETQDC